jgi:hypothetical protein
VHASVLTTVDDGAYAVADYITFGERPRFAREEQR